MVSAWRNFKNIFSTPLFTIIFRPEMLKFHPYSILTGVTIVGFVIFCVLRIQTKPEQKFTKTYGLEVVVGTMHSGLSRPSGVLHILSRSLANFLEQIKLCTGQYTKLCFGRISNQTHCVKLSFMWTFLSEQYCISFYTLWPISWNKLHCITFYYAQQEISW